MWAGLNGFDPRNDLVLGGVRVGMNLVTAISGYTRVPVTLMELAQLAQQESSVHVVKWQELLHEQNLMQL